MRSARPSASRDRSGDHAAWPVETEQLTRVFATKGRRARTNQTVAVDEVSLRLRRGELHGLLGPNGAGKTTFVKILSTVLLPTAGTARVAGFDVVDDAPAVREAIGIVFGGERGLYSRLTARQNLRYWAALYRMTGSEGRRRADDLLVRVGLTERADERVETYSRGMKQRLHLARGLIGDPQVLFLDEPTTGLDPVGARGFRNLIKEVQSEGRTILLATHDMAEAEAVCDRVTLIDRGRLIATESPRTIGSWIASYERVDCAGADPVTLEQLRSLPGVSSVTEQANGMVRIQTSAEGTTAQVFRLLADAGVGSVCTSLPSLEEVYLQLIGDRGLEI
jgi:ABC-2 type transport system ATP-binding protein